MYSYVNIFLTLLGVAMIWQGTASQGLNSGCTSDPQCSSVENAECISGTCQCKDGTVAVNSRCLPVASNIGAGCEDEKQCSWNLGSNVECKEYQCSCRTNHTAVQVSGRDRCEPLRELSGSCVANQQCVSNYSVCKDEICACASGYTVADNVCLPNKNYQDSCIAHAQCYQLVGKLAGCRQNKCICEEATFHNGTMCVSKKGLGENCVGELVGCHIANSFCNATVCTCKSGYLPSSDEKSCTGSGVERILASITLLLAMLLLPSRLR